MISSESTGTVRLSLLLILLLFLPGCLKSEYSVATHKQDIFFYSAEKEVSLGQSIHRQISRELPLSNNLADRKRIRAIGREISAVCDRKEITYYFYIIEEEQKNAFSVPGGYVYIYRGLLEEMKDDSELAFVLAHEIGHIVARHSIKKLQAAMGANLLAIAAITAEKSPGFHQGLSFAISQLMAAYSREDEFKADELACKYMSALDYSPSAGIEVLEKLYEFNRREPARPISYFRTHPFVPQRIANIKEVLGMPLDVSDYMNR